MKTHIAPEAATIAKIQSNKISQSESFQISEDFIQAGVSDHGGWNKSKLEILGEPWHQQPDCKQRGNGRSSSKDNAENFLGTTIYTRHEVAGILKLSVRTVDDLLKSKAISFLKIGRSVRITAKALQEFRESRTINALK